MRYYQRVQWLAVVFILLVGLVGCDSGDGGLTAPANVPAGSASPANFWVGRGGDKLQIYQGGSGFQITVPEGAYLLTYVTHFGVFNIVFSSEEGAFFAVGLLEGDELTDLYLQEGDIPEEAVPVEEKEGVKVYCRPGVTAGGGLPSVFTGWGPIIIIIQGGVVVPDNPFMVIIVLTDPIVENTGPGKNYTIWTYAEGGSITPKGPLEVPGNSSRSFKFIPNTLPFDKTTDQVYVNGVNVTPQVQVLGNGQGHLVIHKIHEHIYIEAYM